MATAKEIIIDVEVNNKVAIDNIVRLKKQLDELVVEQTKLQGAYDLGLKTQEEYDKEMTAVAAAIRDVKTQMRETNKQIDANIQKQEAQEGSLKQMRAELKNLVKAYDEMSAAERESTKGQEQKQKILDLQKSLKELEGETGRFQRNVGDYRNAIEDALNGVIPLKTALTQLNAAIGTAGFQLQNMSRSIDDQKAKLQELARTVGTDSQEYKEQAQILDDLQKKYNETSDAMTQMGIAAGDMDDAMRGARASTKNFGEDNANIKAVSEGIGVIANSYQVAQSAMAAFGIQSEAMIEIWAKMQVIQQGVAALNQILAAFEKESILRQQIQIALNKIFKKSIDKTAAAKTKDAAASAAAAAGDTALAAGETAATAAAGGLVTALKAVGAAIKSIPIIGWILLAVGALTTLVALIVRAHKASKDGNDTLKQRIQLQKELLDIEKQSLSSVKQQEIMLRTNVERVKSLKEGTEEWKQGVKDIADGLGVDAQWLQKNIDKVDDLTEAWVRMKVAMAKSESYAQAMADNEIKIAQAQAQIESTLSSTHWKERVDVLKKEYNLSTKLAEKLDQAYHDKLDSKGAKKETEEYNKVLKEVLSTYIGGLENANEIYKAGIEESINEAAEAGKVLNDGVTTAGNNATETAEKTADEIKKNAKKLAEDLEDLMVEGMADGLEKQVKEIQLASDRWVQSMKEAREKDLDNKDLYDALIAEKERQTQAKINKIRDEGYKQIAQQIKSISNAYNDVIADSKTNPLAEFITKMKKITEDTDNIIKGINNDIKKAVKNVRSEISLLQKDLINIVDVIGEDKMSNMLIKMGFTEDEAKRMAKEVKEKLEEAFKNQETTITLSGKIGNGQIKNWTTDITNFFKVMKSGLSGLEKVELWDKLSKIFGDIEEKQKEINKLKKTGVNINVETLITTKKIDQEYYKTAKTIQEQLLRQAEEGSLGVIPETFEVYIDFKIEDLETKLAETKDKLSKLTPVNIDFSAYENQLVVVEDITKQLEEQKKILASMDKSSPEFSKTKKAVDKLEKELETAKKRLKEIYSDSDEYKKVKQQYESITSELEKQRKLLQDNANLSPDQFTAIENSIKELEDEADKLKSRMEKLFKDNEDYEKTKKEYEDITKELETQYKLLQSIQNANKFAKIELQIETGKDLKFFDSTEIMAQQLLISKLKAQIEALTEAKAKGMLKEQEISAKEAELNKMREDYNNNSEMWDKSQQEKSKNAIKRKQEEIEALKAELAALGYTGSDQMQKLIDELNAKMSKESKIMKAIWAQNASTVLQSFQKVTSAFEELISTIGEDNAELTNFLEAIGYVNIMLNMAVGISEAVAAGAGQMFPYNIAAIAAGVAAVVAGITQAISLYKQNHKNVSSPKFAQGGVIGGRTARSKSEGKRDDVPIWASKGEYIINAEVVKKYGIDFFDEINFGKKLKKLNLTGRYAEGGVVTQTVVQQANNQTMDYSGLVDALQQMPNPVVSVQEINSKQRRVQVKENIAKNK